MIEKTIRAEAADKKKGMTADELRVFLGAALDAHPDAPVRVLVNYKGGIRRIEVGP